MQADPTTLSASTQVQRTQHGKPRGVVRDDQPNAREGQVGRVTAAMLVLKPIFEADLPPELHAYRPGRNARGGGGCIRRGPARHAWVTDRAVPSASAYWWIHLTRLALGARRFLGSPIPIFASLNWRQADDQAASELLYDRTRFS